MLRNSVNSVFDNNAAKALNLPHLTVAHLAVDTIYENKKIKKTAVLCSSTVMLPTSILLAL